jgi:hypothetical protein
MRIIILAAYINYLRCIVLVPGANDTLYERLGAIETNEVEPLVRCIEYRFRNVEIGAIVILIGARNGNPGKNLAGSVNQHGGIERIAVRITALAMLPFVLIRSHLRNPYLLPLSMPYPPLYQLPRAVTARRA